MKTEKVNEEKNSQGDRASSLSPTQESGLAGRELDAAIATRVMGWRRELQAWYSPAGHAAEIYQVPRYSSDLAAAMSVVEKLMSMGYRYVMRGNFQGSGLHWAGFDDQEWADLNPLNQSPRNGLKSLPEAICRAALAATKE